MTTPRRTPAGPRTPGRATTPAIPDPRTGEKDLAEMEEPYDLPQCMIAGGSHTTHVPAATRNHQIPAGETGPARTRSTCRTAGVLPR